MWSLKSGKTRIFWNRRDISHLFQTNGKSGLLELAWETRSQERLQVLAHSESTPGAVQYDLLIDGVSFFGLPSKEMVQASASRTADKAPRSLTGSFHGESRAESLSALSEEESLRAPNTPENLGWRLSLAGFSAGALEREPVDELHSDVYSTMVESLRSEITNHLPQTEGLVSRAIIHAFFPDSDSETAPSYGSFSITERDPLQVEADFLSRADEWARLNLDFAPAPDAEDRALQYFQKHVENLFSYVRNEELAPEDASRILLNVAALLRLEFARPLLGDTVVVKGLDTMKLDDFSSTLSSFGSLLAIGLDTKRGLGFCRFKETMALEQFQSACACGTAFPTVDRVRVRFLSDIVKEERRGTKLDELLPERVETSEGSTEDDPFPPAARGGDSVPHLMASVGDDILMYADPHLTPLIPSRSVSDGWVDTGLYDDVKMPRRVTPDSAMHTRSTFFSDEASAMVYTILTVYMPKEKPILAFALNLPST